MTQYFARGTSGIGVGILLKGSGAKAAKAQYSAAVAIVTG